MLDIILHDLTLLCRLRKLHFNSALIFPFYRRKDYTQLIERHKVLVSDLKRQLDIPRILVSEACKDLIEVDIESMTEVN